MMIARLHCHPVLEGLAVTLGAALIAAHIGIGIATCSGCSPAQARAATFAGELEACMQTSGNCQDYVACQHSTQRRYDQPISGSCDLTTDGGAK